MNEKQIRDMVDSIGDFREKEKWESLNSLINCFSFDWLFLERGVEDFEDQELQKLASEYKQKQTKKTKEKIEKYVSDKMKEYGGEIL